MKVLKMRSISLRVLRTIAIAIILFLALLYFFQRPLIFPGAYHLHSKEKIESNLPIIKLTTPDGVEIQLLKASSEKETDRAILMLHGNADLASNQIQHLNRADILDLGFNVYALEYRGYNENKGYPSENTLNIDALTALQYLEKQGYKKIIYYGHSIGTGVATRLVKEKTPFALILESPFNNLAKAAHYAFPFIPKPVTDVLLKDEFASDETLATTEVPHVLIMHAQDDPVLNFHMGEDLFKKVKSPHKVFIESQTGGHNDVLLFKRKDLIEFLKSLD